MNDKENKKTELTFISKLKKELLINLEIVNNKLDTYRTNINIVKYNLLTNDKIKDNQLPNFDFKKANELLNLFGNLLNGTIKNYNDILNQILSKNFTGDVNKTSLKKEGEKK